jgi:alpha-glucosidase
MPHILRCLLLLFVPLIATAQWQTIGNAEFSTAHGRTAVTLKATGATLEVTVLADDLVRVHLTPPTAPGQKPPSPSPSWAVIKTEWARVDVEIADAPDALTLTTPALQVRIGKKPVRLAFYDHSGTLLNEDHPLKGMSWISRTRPDSLRDAPGTTGAEVRVWKSSPLDEYYYGFGEKSASFAMRGRNVTMWNTDIPAYNAGTDPLYQTIPFFMGMRNGRAYGVFFDNTYWSNFDMGKESRDQYSFGAEGGDLDYYFFAGPTPKSVLSRFTELVGRMPLPPLWSLGYQQSRWSYSPESRVREIARGFRENNIPCDVIYLDIDYMDGYRVFTWSPVNFPDPRRLVADLTLQGFRVAVIMDPGIKTDSMYAAYRSGLSADCFVKYPDGRVFMGDVWPGRCAFPDFTADAARRWWGDQMSGLVDVGVRGYWNDMNEPSVFNTRTKTLDLAALHNDRGLWTRHAKNHNVYGMQMTRATYEGALRQNPSERPFVLTRASYAGGWRYSASWTGDNVASWEHLQMALSMSLSLSVSGQPFVGADIGGFIGYPSPELFARWLQLGVFTPLMRAHSVINEKNKEPWEFGAQFTEINRSAIALRYRLLPYIYNVMVDASRTGIPAMRPLMLEYPGDPRFAESSQEFFFGDDLLIAPVLTPDSRQREVPLPQGTWYDFHSGSRTSGGSSVRVEAPLDRIPVFVREGAIVPSQQTMQYARQEAIDPLTLTVYPLISNGAVTTHYYEDDGKSFDYLKGAVLRRNHTQQRAANTLAVEISAAEGTYRPPARHLVLVFVDVAKEPVTVMVNGTPLTKGDGLTAAGLNDVWRYDPATRSVTARTADRFTGQRFELRYE